MYTRWSGQRVSPFGGTTLYSESLMVTSLSHRQVFPCGSFSSTTT